MSDDYDAPFMYLFSVLLLNKENGSTLHFPGMIFAYEEEEALRHIDEWIDASIGIENYDRGVYLIKAHWTEGMPHHFMATDQNAVLTSRFITSGVLTVWSRYTQDERKNSGTVYMNDTPFSLE